MENFNDLIKKELEDIKKDILMLKDNSNYFDYVDIAESLKLKFKSCGVNSKIFAPAKINNPQNITIGDNVILSSFLWVHTIERYMSQKFNPSIIIGDNTYIGHYVELGACNKIKIGKGCMIADHVFIADTGHEYRDINMPINNSITEGGEIIIGDETWIGDGVKILPSTKIGSHCVVGANSVIKGIFPDYSVIVGVPGKIVKKYNTDKKIWERVDNSLKIEIHEIYRGKDDTGI